MDYEYMSIPEFAKCLGVSRIAVYKRVKSGHIEAKRIGRNFAIPKKCLAQSVGGELDEAGRRELDRGVKRVFAEYGGVVRLMGER
ncbi:MAG: helix-turn-helix domain-containing protein [Candidatus Omnitrophota bacterium]|nr:helix-turn-helix domain-containing protein [Candidatus Omnitrophota bacterium]